MDEPRPLSLFDRVTGLLGWTPHSIYIISAFVLVCSLIAYIWWPLAVEYVRYVDWAGDWWLYFDWLLVGIFLVMSFLIMAKADLRADAMIVFVGLCGGLVIESWGTQTYLWYYFTAERPPLWIIPAWPIASLSIDRITRMLEAVSRQRSAVSGQRSAVSGQQPAVSGRFFKIIYWPIFVGFYIIMLIFVAPTFYKSFTVMSLLLCALLILTPTDHRKAVLVFIAGAGLGYFLELWGTTRECWTYYTRQTPPFFAVLAHGMAAVAFWRAQLVLEKVVGRLKVRMLKVNQGNKG